MKKDENTILLYSPVYITENTSDNYELNDVLYDEPTEYMEDLLQGFTSFQRKICPTNAEKGIIDILNYPKSQASLSASGKIDSIESTIAIVQNALYCQTEVVLNESLSPTEHQQLEEDLAQHLALDIGDELEVFPIPIKTDESKVLFISLNRGHDSDDFFITPSEPEQYPTQEKEEPAHADMSY